jgi:hypothetical protein
MEKDGYEHIVNYSAEISIEKSNEPLIAPRRDDPIWKDIDEKLEVFLQEKIAQNSSYDRIRFNENSLNIITGATNLINFILTNQDHNPIKTLVFLDKSARLAAHVFRVLWSTLEKQGKLPSEAKMPRIKFINVGLGENHKHEAPRSLDLAAEVFPKRDIEGEGVLIIDEIVDSGGSLRRAMKSLEDKYSAKPQGMANFISLPGWYFRSRSKGVEDPNLPKIIYD